MATALIRPLAWEPQYAMGVAGGGRQESFFFVVVLFFAISWAAPVAMEVPRLGVQSEL